MAEERRRFLSRRYRFSVVFRAGFIVCIGAEEAVRAVAVHSGAEVETQDTAHFLVEFLRTVLSSLMASSSLRWVARGSSCRRRWLRPW